jgi:hypothetical protein
VPTRLNIGCGRSPTPDGINYDNSPMYDRDSLVALVEAAGFVEVEPVEEGCTRIADPGGLDLNEREADSLSLEARRP